MICRNRLRKAFTKEASILLASFFILAPAGYSQSFDPDKEPGYYRVAGTDNWAKFESNEIVPDSNLGFRPKPNNQARHVLRTRERLIWDIRITTDQHGRRVVPQKEHPGRRKFLAFFGCSFTYGTGLADDQTLPYFVGEALPSYRVYNYSIPSSAPNLMLALLEEGKLPQQIEQKKGVFVYVGLNFHVGRANGYMAEASWMSETPYYEYGVDGELLRKGSFASERPATISVYKWAWPLIQRWTHGKMNFPPPRDAHFKYVCDIVKQSRRNFLKMFPGSSFVVADHPIYRMDERVISCLRDDGIKVFTTTASFAAEDGYMIPGDGHPTEKFNREYGKLLSSWLADVEKN